MDRMARRFWDVGESIFAQMTRRAIEKNAINLAQGFPDFNGPYQLIERMHYYLDNCPNQYTRSSGHLALCKALETYSQAYLPRAYTAVDEITVVNGATEGILCTILGLVDPKKKVLVFEPYYESYLACAKMAGAELIGVPLLPPKTERDIEDGIWHVDWPSFDQGLDDVALIMLNHPHNPTGKVFTKDELERIFKEAEKRDIPVAIDGVYEHLVYPPYHRNFAPFLAKYSDNTIFISAISKTFSYTGFKVGWVLAPRKFTRGIRAVHEAAVFCQAPHMQLAVADVLQDERFFSIYVEEFRQKFLGMRNDMRKILLDFGFLVPNTQGTYFLMAEKHNAPLTYSMDYDMAMELLDRFGVATLPVSGFYHRDKTLKTWLRIAFCKRPETIIAFKEALLL